MSWGVAEAPEWNHQWGAGRKLGMVLDNAVRVVAVELMCAAEGIDRRQPLRPAPTTAAVRDLIRTVVPRLDRDRPPGPSVEAIADLIERGEFDQVG